MNPAVLAILILAAVLVGAAVPVLLQLRATLKSVETTLDELRPQIRSTLSEVESAAARLNRVAVELEQSASQAKAIVASVADLGKNVSQFGRSIRSAATLGGVIGPAFVAALRAFGGRGNSNAAPTPEPDEPSSAGMEDALETPQETRS